MKAFTNFLFTFLLVFLLVLAFSIASNREFYQDRAEQLNNSQSIVLDTRGCNLINLNLKNRGLKSLEIENNMCIIDGDYKVEYVEPKKYRLILKETNLIINEDNIISDRVSLQKSQNSVKTNNDKPFLKDNKKDFAFNLTHFLLFCCFIIFVIIVPAWILYIFSHW